jgi:hypothetical protein
MYALIVHPDSEQHRIILGTNSESNLSWTQKRMAGYIDSRIQRKLPLRETTVLCYVCMTDILLANGI